MAITTRDLTPADVGSTAALMARIEADHPTGFCLAADEIAELMRDKPDAAFEGAFDGDELVAYTTVMPSQPHGTGQRFVLFGDVAPERTGEGIGTLMLGRSLDRARAIHAVDAPDLPARYASQALAGRDDQGDLMTSAGFEQGRHCFLMVADLSGPVPAPGLPDDLEVSTFDPETAEELRLAHNAAFADYPDGTPIDASFWRTFMVTAQHTRHHLSVVARDASGAVVGYVFGHEYAVPMSGGAGPEVYVPYVGTLPSHRGRGLATALLARMLHLCQEAGVATASLNVDTHNPTGALGIYERAGFREAYRQDFYHRVE